jgi:hypothetical protein
VTRRERLEAKLEKRAEWAAKARARSAQRFATGERALDGIPFGQPILVGHHSERRHRAAIEKCHSNTSKGVEEAKLADHHTSKAGGLADQLDGSIFSDDPDAVERLEEKAAALDAAAERCVAVNKAWRRARKGLAENDPPPAGWSGGLLPPAHEDATTSRGMEYSWLRRRGPMDPAYDRANARRARQRVEDVKLRQARAARAEAGGGTLVEVSGAWARITFPEKPSRDVLDALRAAGFHWGGGRWIGEVDKIPAAVRLSQV